MRRLDRDTVVEYAVKEVLISRQHFLLRIKNKELIREEAKSLIENWSTSEGGFIAVCCHGSDIGVSDEIIRAAFETLQEYGGKSLCNIR